MQAHRILMVALLLTGGCGESNQRLTVSDHDAIGTLVKRETGKTSYRLVQNAPCSRPCSASRRRSDRHNEPFANSLESCGFLAVVGEGRSETILQIERSWRGWATCSRSTPSEETAGTLGQPLPLNERR